MENKLYGTAIIKAKKIMDLLAESDNGLTLNEMSQKLAISKPTILKILNTLIYIKFARRDNDTKKYYLGTVFIKYGHRALTGFDISNIAYEYLDKLRNFTNETINLGIVDSDKIFILQKLNGDQTINFNSQVGDTMELYSSAMGKAALAAMSSQRLDEYLDRVKLVPLTNYTITNVEQLKQQLWEINERGYSIDNQENQDDVICVGATIMKYNRMFAAFSVSTPKYRLSEELLSKFIKKVIITKRQIEDAL